MAKADAEYRNIGLKEFFNRLDSVIARRRVARAVGEEEKFLETKVIKTFY